jgi:predicted metalloprotease with PDZ domain
MQGVDLSVFRFDYDLTFAVLFMHPNGHVYHHYGNRTPESADARLSMPSLEHVMRATREAHAIATNAEKAPPAPAWKGRAVEQLPTMARRVKAGKGPECFHCHMVNQAVDEEAQEKGSFDPRVAWRYPPSTQIGLHLDRDEPTLVTAVAEGSPAADAGLRAGDRLARLGQLEIASEGDIQRVLDVVPATGSPVSIHWVRGDEVAVRSLKLEDGWRVGAPEELWRSTMWRLDPRPGFGGKLLSDAEKQELGLGDGQSAFRVTYVVTWGPHARTGRNAAKAGVRKGDVVLSVGGKDDFKSQIHFHAWFRLTRKVGETIPIVILRDGERQTLELTVIE